MLLNNKKWRPGIFIVTYKRVGKEIKYLILKRKLHWKGYEFPKGGIEKKESLKKKATRELKEETGYSGENFELLSKFYGTIGYNNEIIEIYKAHATVKGHTNFDEHEAIELFEMDLPDLLKMIDTGEIIDAKTIVGILLIAREMGIN